MAAHIRSRRHNPHYLGTVQFNTSLLTLTHDPVEVLQSCDTVMIAIPSAYVLDALDPLPDSLFAGKQVVSAVKGILPLQNMLVNDYLCREKGFDINRYFTVMGPCHAEEVAAEKLSYLTFSGLDQASAEAIAAHFQTPYLNTVVNTDVYGVQFAAILKNIYALGAGIAHGLEYGDNFLSVFIANAADEMAGFLRKVGIRNIEVGVHTEDPLHHRKTPCSAAIAPLVT
jgi:glycerol-3-phosphate dehydrogenase (NAD(P)+)